MDKSHAEFTTTLNKHSDQIKRAEDRITEIDRHIAEFNTHTAANNFIKKHNEKLVLGNKMSLKLSVL